MLYLMHDPSSSDHGPTPLNAAEEIHAATAEFHVPRPPPKPRYEYRVQKAAMCETNFRHSHWRNRRRVVRDALASAGASTFQLDAFENCGSACMIEMTKGGEKVRLRAAYCHSKHCEPCMRAKGNKIAANLRNKLSDENTGRCRFITLTVRHSKRPLQMQIRKLYADFKKMRGFKEWRESQYGGAAMLEVKFDPATGEWHPHLHVISEGKFLHKRDLVAMWHRATGDSYIADIRQMQDKAEVCHYVTKYISKGTSPSVWEIQSVAQEWIIASRGVRTMATYGTWRGFKLLQTTDTGEEWKPVASLIALYNAIAAGEEWALRLIKRLEERRLGPEKHKPPQMVLFEN